MSSPKAVLITGASSGLGLALACEYARRGVRVAMVARGKTALEKATSGIRGKGGVAVPIVADVTVIADVQRAVAEAHEALGGLDMVVANAGIGAPKHATELTVADVAEVVDVNVRGAFVTLVAALPIFLEQKRGHLVGISSVAGRRGLPRAGAYSASKAALSTFLETLRHDLVGTGVRVTDVQPGFVDTPATANAKSRPFLVGADEAAKAIVSALKRGPAVFAFPSTVSAAVTASHALPDAVVRFLAKRSS